MAPTKAVDIKKAKLQVIVDDFDIGFSEYESAKENITANQLHVYFEDFQSKLKEFNDIYVEYSCLLKEEEEQGTVTSFKNFKRQIQVTLFEIKSAIMAHRVPTNVEASSTSSNQHNVRKIKMPEIKLPEFDGNFEKWIHFRDTFKSLVHENPTFSTIDKFHYLRAAVKIEPSSQNILNNYKFSEENYVTSWNALCERFDDKRTLLLQHAVSLFQVKKAIDDSPSEIRRIIDSYQSSRCAFNQMNVTTEELNDIIFEQLVRYRLDEKSLREWDLHVQKVNPTWDELYKFLEKRSRSLTFTDKKSSISSSSKQATPQVARFSSKPKVLIASDQTKFPCKLCAELHPMFACPSYLKENLDKRNEIVMNLKLCKNCLRQGHQVKDCYSKSLCKICGQKHHSSLHKFEPVQTKSQEQAQSNDTAQGAISLMSTNTNSRALVTTSQTLLSTVKLLIQDVNGNWQVVRAILDSGSDENLITQDMANKLGLKLTTIHKSIHGINNKETAVRHEMIALVKSRYAQHNDFVNSFKFLVFPTITGILPSFYMDSTQFKLPSNYFMADDEFNIPAKVDMLIGVKCFWDCMLMEKHTLPNNAILIHTKFGWIVSGEAQMSSQPCSSHSMIATSHVYHSMQQVADKLEKFWTIEQCESNAKLLTKEEKLCEDSFIKTTVRDDNGRYIVNLPFKDNINELGNNLPNAIQRFKYLESRFKTNEEFYKKYKQFINEYEALGHMSEVKDINTSLNSSYYFPHHGVIKNDSTTTKLRVVFDASCKSQSGLSLNDTVNVGPIVQPELYDTMIKFMTKPCAVKADIEKMYRQVIVNPSQQSYQRIVWRDNPNQQFRHYQLKTVTYGTSCAPYLATRTLVQIADDYKDQYPEVCELIKSNFYVDDLLLTCESVSKATQLRKDLCNIFRQCGMSLRKWVSNSPEFMKQIPRSETESVEDSHEIKALGLMWNIKTDTFSFKLKDKDPTQSTLSSVLSHIASIYDPIGWLGPVILTAKLFMKKLWSRNLKWNCKLPEDLQEEWDEFYASLSSIVNINIQRQVICSEPASIQLHGFCDASINAYGIVIYARTIDQQGKIHCRILTAKSRVAPTKQITLARLELCGLVLLSKFMRRVSTILNIPDIDIYLWCDSLIVLHWIQAEPANLSVFVGNRVAEIQDQAKGFKFKHIRSNHNPADIISRGLTAYELSTSEFWWNGPEFLKQPQQNWPESMLEIDPNNEEYQKEYRKVLTSQVIDNSTELVNYINERYSSPRSVSCVFATILVGIDNWKRKALKTSKAKVYRVQYIKLAEKAVIRILQNAMFNQEIKALSNGKSVSNNSTIKQLYPFIDHEGLLRTSGRISSCKKLEQDTKHQLILPKCKFVYNLIRQIHTDNCHSTKLSTLAFVRQQYWPLHAKSIISYVIHHCITCFKAKPTDSTQLMGELPADRINDCYPFSKVSVDYAGPINLKASTLRSTAIVKAYIALFKCITTKAIHLELVSDLSSASFIATLDRFTSRRGLPTDIYSDNATCFEGADNIFKKTALELQPELELYYNNKQIKWHFITPRAPHMGGYWESGIKQAKHHLKRILTEKHLTFEEMTTVLCRVEAILNSRPITALSDDPNDIEALTPGHFLIGRPLNSKLEHDITATKSNRLTRWHVIQQTQQLFWKQWYDDIINNQTRPKGFQFEVNYKLDDLVLIKESNVPTMKWKLGRIIKLIPGKDSIVRNVRIKSATGEIERHVRYICKLPTEEEIALEAVAEC